MSFEEFIEKEINKEMFLCLILSIIIALILGTIIFIGVRNKRENLFIVSINEENVYKLNDESIIVVNEKDNVYIFAPVELGDWYYELQNKDELSKIMATYFINKFHLNENKAIDKANNILNSIK